MLADFPVTIAYAQILVHTADHPAPGLLWTDDHTAQGFAWSQDQVAFAVPDHDGECRIEIDLADAVVLDDRVLWAVQVPFSVTGPVEIGALFDPHSVAVPVGNYNLVHQGLPGTEQFAYLLRLTFSRCDQPEFRILKTGGDITADVVLCTDAEPAG